MLSHLACRRDPAALAPVNHLGRSIQVHAQSDDILANFLHHPFHRNRFLAMRAWFTRVFGLDLGSGFCSSHGATIAQSSCVCSPSACSFPILTTDVKFLEGGGGRG